MRKTLKKGLGAVLLAGMLVVSTGGIALAGSGCSGGSGGCSSGRSGQKTSFPGIGSESSNNNTCSSPWCI